MFNFNYNIKIRAENREILNFFENDFQSQLIFMSADISLIREPTAVQWGPPTRSQQYTTITKWRTVLETSFGDDY